MRRDWFCLLLLVLLPMIDLWWNLAHLNIGLVDFYGLSAFAQAFVSDGAWPATPYFPAGYPLLLIPFGLLGNSLIGGYVLTALGMMLALYAAVLLARELGARGPACVAIVVLCWLAPVFRVSSGSPSVDGLYTGLGMWFLASALAIWRHANKGHGVGQGGLPRWVLLGLCLPALLLPLLRYHAIILVAPVLLVLALLRRGTRAVLISLLTVAIATVFNYLSYYYYYHEALPSVAGLQVLTGLELGYHKLYQSPGEELWNDYPHFCQLARTTAISSIFSVREIASHWLRNWVMFLRQPSVLLLFVMLSYALVSRRSLRKGSAIGLIWVAAYTMVLALAYYTARSAVLPVMLATILCITTATDAISSRSRWWAVALTAVVLVTGYVFASNFALLDYTARLQWSDNSRWLDRIPQVHKVLPSGIAVTDWRYLPLRNNPWAAPYVTLSASWIDDPAIHPRQRASIKKIAISDLEQPNPLVRYVVVVESLYTAIKSNNEVVRSLSHHPQWRTIARTQNADATFTCVYALRDNFNPASGAGLAVP